MAKYLKESSLIQMQLLKTDFFLRAFILFLSFFWKSILYVGSYDIQTRRRNLPIITQIDIYYAFVILWPLCFDLFSILLYLYHEKNSPASESKKKEIKHFIFSDLIIPDIALLIYYVVFYFGVFPLWENLVGTELSGHWLKFSLHNANLIRNICFHLKLKEYKINRAYMIFIPMDLIIILTSYWSLFWTALLYHNNFECIVGFAIGSFGVFIFQNEEVKAFVDQLTKIKFDNVLFDIEMNKSSVVSLKNNEGLKFMSYKR